MKKIIFISVAVILALNYQVWLPLPGTLLLVKDNIGKADCIVPLNGDDYFRFQKAVNLSNQGYAKPIVLSATPERENKYNDFYNLSARIRGMKDLTSSEMAFLTFKYFGKDPKDVYLTEGEVTSTFDEAVATKEYMLKNKMKSMILVTSTYHMRRALWTFKAVFFGTGIKIYNCTAESSFLDPHHWWRKERDVKNIFEEYVYIAYNFLYHFVLGKGRTSFDTC